MRFLYSLFWLIKLLWGMFDKLRKLLMFFGLIGVDECLFFIIFIFKFVIKVWCEKVCVVINCLDSFDMVLEERVFLERGLLLLKLFLEIRYFKLK